MSVSQCPISFDLGNLYERSSKIERSNVDPFLFVFQSELGKKIIVKMRTTLKLYGNVVFCLKSICVK